MTPALFAAFLAVIVLSAFFWVRVCNSAVVAPIPRGRCGGSTYGSHDFQNVRALRRLRRIEEVIGYSIDLCMKIVEAIKVTQKLPKLQVKLQPVSAATRIPQIANGTVDLECGATTNTTECQQQVSFAVTTFVASTRLAWK
jgi:ABC-type amino acid transport substrate-binding protein